MSTVLDFLSAAIKNKPLDGSDVKTLQEAQAELGRLRRVNRRICDLLAKATTEAAASKKRAKDGGGGAAKKKRGNLKIDDSYKTYKKVTVQKSNSDRELLRLALQKNPLFDGVTELELEEFIDVFQRKKFAANETVIQQGDEGETFYVVHLGSLDIFINAGGSEMQVGVPYCSGSTFGELALIYGSPRAATIRASEDCILWEINRTAFKGIQLHNEQKSRLEKLAELRKVKIGNKLFENVMSPSQLESMALATHTQAFKNGDDIVREGEKGDVFYVITKGEVDVFKKAVGNDKLCTLGAHSFFGEKALLGSDTRQATCVAASDVECLTLTREDFTLMLGNLDDLLSGRKPPLTQSFIQGIASEPSNLSEDDILNSTNFAFSDLKVKRVLGEGAFGKVNLVKSRPDKKIFALKAQSKAVIVERGLEDAVVREYNIMREVNHVFVVKCYQSFQDKKYVYFLMSLLPGGELMDLLDEKEKFPEAWSRFYGATVLSVFQCMHSNRIAYRDLKPENLVLNEDGYCFVVDFGLAKKIDEGITWTFCGTPDYLAPEIIKGKGHDWGADYWAFGVLLYELTNGETPFYSTDPSTTAKKIIKGSYPTPSHFTQELTDLVSRLLSENSKRLGRIKGGITKLQKHAWFSKFDWQGLLDRTLDVPWKPTIGNLEKIGTKDFGQEDAADSSWNPVFE